MEKRILCTLLAVVLLLSCAACASETPTQTENSTELVVTIATEPAVEPTVDPFEIDDGIVDSTNEIVIDFYEFLDEKNAEHKAALELTYSDEFIKENTPDFYDTLDLVTKEEAEKLLNTPRGEEEKKIPKEAALKDIELLFRIFKCYFGAYFYHGGDAFFETVKEKMVAQINHCPDTLTLEEFAGIISSNLDFVHDRHMHIGDKTVCDYNYISLYDFCVKDLYFYQDDVGYYTRIHDRKWYLEQVGSDSAIVDYLQITVDENGQLCYCILLCEPKNGIHLEISEITLSRGERTATRKIEWSMFNPRNFRMIQETTTVKNNIPLLSVGSWIPGRGIDGVKADEQCQRMSQIGRAYFTQDVFIFDFVSGSGGYEMFESIPHACPEFIAYRLSQLAEDLGMWMRPWEGQTIGPFYIPLHKTAGKGQYATYYKTGLWGENDTIAFTVQDKTNFSASEWHILDARAIENVLTIGGSTGGTSDNGAGHNMILYNTGLGIELADSLGRSGTGELDDLCIKPDIWYEPEKAADAAYRICEFYGIENTADPSGLFQYDYIETEYQEEYEEYLYYKQNPHEQAPHEQNPHEQAPHEQNPHEQAPHEQNPHVIHSDNDARISVTEFDYDLNADGKAENYIFGINFVGYLDKPYFETEKVYLNLGTSNYIGKGNYVYRSVYPCVWRVEDDGTMTVAKEFASLLTDVQIVTKLLEGQCASPSAEKISHTWPGCTKFTFETINIQDCTWQYEVAAKLGDQALTATHATNIIR